MTDIESPLSHLTQGLSASARARALADEGSPSDEAWELALAHLTRAVADDPSSGEAWLARAQAHVALERFDEADQDQLEARRVCLEAVERSPDDWRAHRRLAEASARADADREMALAHLERAVELAPAEAGVFELRGDMLARAPVARHEEAIAAYTRAIELGGPTINRLLTRGECRESVGQLDAALSDYELGVTLYPGEACFYNRRAELLMQLALTGPSPGTDGRWLLAAADYASFRKLWRGSLDWQVDIRLIAPPERIVGLVFELHFGPEALMRAEPLEGRGEVTRQVHESLFTELAGIFNFDDRLDWWGLSSYPPEDLPTVRARALAHRRGLDEVGSYLQFVAHAVETGWMLDLTRASAEHEARWEGWLDAAKRVSDELLALLDEAERKGWALWIAGI
jgi:tetratricopeptide (TPR) repeat protein